MGTNFYRVFIPSEDDIKKMHELVNDRKFNSLTEFMKHFTEARVHIGKRSCGWKFSFDHNYGEHYKPTRESITAFLSEPNTRILDEYGDGYTVDEFWKEVDEWNADPHNYRTSKIYADECAANGEYVDRPCTSEIENCREMFGVNPEHNDFESDGLRFPVYSDYC